MSATITPEALTGATKGPTVVPTRAAAPRASAAREGFSLRRLWHMVRKEVKQLLRDPKARPLIFVAPLVQMLLLGYAATTDVQNIRTMVVDHDRTVESRALVDAFKSSGYFVITRQAERDADVATALAKGEADVGLTIPPGFSRDMHTTDGAAVQALFDGADASLARVAQSYAGQVAAQYGVRALGAVQPGGVDLRSRAWFNPSLESRFFNVPAIMGTLLMMVSLMLTALGVVREREIGTLDQLLVSPIRSAELMLGKTIPVLGVGCIHLVFCTSLALFHFGVPMRGSFLVLGLAAMLYLVAGLSLGLLISTVSSTQQEAFMLLILFFLPAVVLSGFLSPVESMPTAFQWLAAFNPLRWFLDIVRGVFLKGVGLRTLWPQFLVLATMSTVTLWLATNRFRRTVA
jgi:ABC-2 type transport system permease protein